MRIKSNQYLPDGFGKPAKTYWYIQNRKGLTLLHNGQWVRKSPKEMNKYVFRSLEEAEQKCFELLNKDN